MTFWHYLGLSTAVFCTDGTVPAWCRVGWAVAWAAITFYVAKREAAKLAGEER